MRTRLIPLALLAVAAGLLAPATTSLASSPRSAPHAGSTSADWIQYHGTRDRAGYRSGMPAFKGGLKVAARIALDGAVYAAPIVGNGLTVVATENDTVYAFDAANRQVWKKHLATPSPSGQRPCGDIDPLGITGTPVYSSRTGLVYLAAEIGGSPPTHRLYALKIGSGAVQFSRSLDFSGVDSAAMQERGALTWANGRIWVPFGGLAGDCGSYKGRLVGYRGDGSGSPLVYTVPTAREAGIWTPPGPSVDSSANLYVAVGNGASGVGDSYDYSDSVLRISSATGKRTDSFSPTTWASDNDGDKDLGSQGPALVSKWIFSAGKSGTAYVLRRSALGGIGGQVSQMSLCHSFGGTAVYGWTVYVPCTDGVRSVSINSSGAMHVRWHTSSAITGAPVLGAGVLWTLDTGSGKLYALSTSTGASKGSVSVGSVTRFATPALSGRRILVGTTSGLTIATY